MEAVNNTFKEGVIRRNNYYSVRLLAHINNL
jgi:hypothetical protein